MLIPGREARPTHVDAAAPSHDGWECVRVATVGTRRTKGADMTARKRKRMARLAAIAGVVALVAASATATSTAAPRKHAAMAKIRISFSTWNGYAGLVIGVKSGIFKKAGLDVQYSVIEDPVARFNALKAGSLDAIATTPDTFARTYARGIKTVQVLGLDASVGGDGIVADKKITSVKQLKGQKVAVSAGSTSQWFLAYVLSVNKLSLKDVKQVDLTSGDAGAAFAAGRVPVAVTWQPWLDRTKKNPNGHVLVSSKQYPTIITDQVGFTPEFIKKNPETVQAFVNAYGQVMDLVKSDPDKAFGYATKYLGQSTTQIKATLKEVPLWTLSQSRAYYGSSSKHGQIYKIFTKAGQFWKSIGEISSVPSPNGAIDPSFLSKAS
jgi:NitT/TauT family transport system substrate-binding protein